jgi:hypothetical protein
VGSLGLQFADVLLPTRWPIEVSWGASLPEFIPRPRISSKESIPKSLMLEANGPGFSFRRSCHVACR